MANGARRTLWQPSGAVGQQLPWYQQGPYLPMTYRQYPRMAFGGGSLGPRQDELAQAGLGAFGPATMGDPGVLPPGFVTAGQAGLVQQPVQVLQPAPAPMTYLPLAGAPSPLAAQAAQAMSQFRPAARGGATGLGGVGAETAGAAGAQLAFIWPVCPARLPGPAIREAEDCRKGSKREPLPTACSLQPIA